MDQTLGVDPTARVKADVELTGAIGDDHCAREKRPAVSVEDRGHEHGRRSVLAIKMRMSRLVGHHLQ